MCARPLNENMRLYNRHYNTNVFKDDSLSSIFHLLPRVGVPGGQKQGGKRIEQNLSATIIADQINSS